MLRLGNIRKSYRTGDFAQAALDGVSLDFRHNEFVAILGESGSGKTTLLNIIGGLDRYDSGDLIIGGKSTKNFKNEDWDAYRNNKVGFIFQSYNLIGHISILKNVEMSMTLSGVRAVERKRRAMDALKRVGLADHANKKPNQLSGGQAQRVAIARALVNNPEVILADEPTGALDSQTSEQIMELIREIAGDKLVIMVTHNPRLAERYATRVIELSDGKVVGDSNPVGEGEVEDNYQKKKTAMSFLTALSLSFNNIMTKKGRTILTAFASSIGIIGIALILSLSNGFNLQIESYQSDTLTGFPIIISPQAVTMDVNDMEAMRENMMGTADSYPETQAVYPYNPDENTVLHRNILSEKYEQYIRDMDQAWISGLWVSRSVGLNVLSRDGELTRHVGDALAMSCLPESPADTEGIVEENYDLLYGKLPEQAHELLLVVDKNNRITEATAAALGLPTEAEDGIAFETVTGRQLRVILNDDYYTQTETGFAPNLDFAALYELDSAISVEIVGIARLKENSYMSILGEGVVYTQALVDRVVEHARDSAIVVAQRDVDYNILSGQPFDLATEEGVREKAQIMSYLGADSTPVMIGIFPRDFDSKERIIEYLDAYNTGKEDKELIVYTDYADTIVSMSGSIMDAITIVLIAFSSISLVVSVIMIGIITYISVLERTKEIGVLRAIGARKKDITRVFNAETFIVGLVSGALGIGIAWLLTIPTNMILENMTGLAGVAQLNPLHALLLVAISVTLTLIGGLIPAMLAAHKDPVVALRTE